MPCAEGLELANSMIEGTKTQLNLMAWKRTHLKNGPTYYSSGSLGPHNWQSFCHQNTDTISAKKAVRLDSKGED
jgi:hypothetical protein